MPPLAIAAGIGAVGSIAGAAISSSAAKKAAKSQQQSADAQLAAVERNRQQVTALSQPAVDRGNAAAKLYAGLLNVGDPAASAEALKTYRSSTGYEDLLSQGLGSINANAYARGTGDSGATLKALQTRGMNIANQNQQQYMGNLGTLMAAGNSAIGNIAGISSALTTAANTINQNTADAAGNLGLAQAGAWSNGLQNLVTLGANYLGNKSGANLASSYGGAASGMAGSPSRYGTYSTPPYWPGAGGIY